MKTKGKPSDYVRLRRLGHERKARKQALLRDPGHAGYVERLKAEALADPADPALWGLYAAAAQGYFLTEREDTAASPLKGGCKSAIVDPLELGQSQLGTLWAGPAPSWGTSALPGDPEESEE